MKATVSSDDTHFVQQENQEYAPTRKGADMEAMIISYL